jgi:hypothetical protein
MYIAIRFEPETVEIEEVVGPFDSHFDASAFLARHWSDYDANDLTIRELSSPDGYGE